MNSTLEVMSFLEPSDLLQLGVVSHEYATLSRHPSLWRNLKISDVKELTIPDLARLMSLTTDKMPLNSIYLSGPTTTGCYCREFTLCKGCSMVAQCSATSTCSSCEALVPLKSS
jgi:hypothetical protein